MVGAGAFRTSVWDPTLIAGQIICLQSAFYSAKSALMFLWSFNGYIPSLAEIFSVEVFLNFAYNNCFKPFFYS